MPGKIICFLLALLLLAGTVVIAQSATDLMEEGKKLEMKFKEEEAIEKYRQVHAADASNTLALSKLSELSGNIGGRQADAMLKDKYYRQAFDYAKNLLKIDSTTAEANYTVGIAYGRMIELELKKDSLLQFVRAIKNHAGKAIAADPAFAKGYNLLGRWHYQVINLNVIKRSTLRVLYGKFPEANIDSAIAYMEKCRQMEPYYCQNFLDLGKAYNFRRQYEKAIAVLEQLAKLPTRRQDDPAIKKEGAAVWQSLQ
jgi:tetratricopeptide (TPR) repeat protein